jgi:hypothetical protein
MEKVGTVAFAHADRPITQDGTSPFESTYHKGEAADVPLGDFLARPVQVLETDITVGGVLLSTFDPWTLFFDNALVKRRVEGFRLARGNLCLRFMITGNPMAFGRFIAAYKPLGNYNIAPTPHVYNESLVCYYTQHMHVFLDPSTGEGGEMKLPFFCTENWLDLSSTVSLASMGDVVLASVVPLDSAISASPGCSIRVFAWMENAELAAPTVGAYDIWTPQAPIPEETSITVTFASMIVSTMSVLMALITFYMKEWMPIKPALRSLSSRNSDETLQASEFWKHPLSSTASAVAKGAGLLATIPELEPYALATETAAGLVTNLAQIFGLSRPQILTNIVRHREFHVGELATANTHEAVARLGVDVKGQLSIDPRTVGLSGVDEMSFAYLLSKDTVFWKLGWNLTDTAGSSLGMLCVTPEQHVLDTSTATTNSIITPQGVIANQFRYWHGTIIYRFRVVASAFHRGRLRIVYDPCTSAASSMNQVYSRIVDIEETRDFEIPVKWHAPTTFLKVRGITPGVGGYYGASITEYPNNTNGIVRIEVLTPLQSPDPTIANEIKILVSQRMTDDAEFMCPYDWCYANNWSLTSPTGESLQAPTLSASEEKADTPGEAHTSMDEVGTTPITPADKTSLVFGGESVKSVRTLLRRYVHRGTVASVSTLNYNVKKSMKHSNLRGTQVLWASYAGWRGSMRQKCVANSDAVITVNHDPTGSASATTFTSPFTALFANTRATEVEIPFYSHRRFVPCLGDYGFTAYAFDGIDDLDPNNGIMHYDISPIATVSVFDAMGEDFALFWHLGLPRVYHAP